MSKCQPIMLWAQVLLVPVLLAALCWGQTVRIGVHFRTVTVHAYRDDVFEVTAPAISIALEQYKKDTGRLQNVTFRFIVYHRAPDTPGTIKKMFPLCLSEDRPHVMFGIISTSITQILGYYIANWKIPLFSHGSTGTVINDKKTYNTVQRVKPNGASYGPLFVNIFRHYGWRRVAMLTHGASTCRHASDAIYNDLKADGVTVTEWITPTLRYEEEVTLERYIDQMVERARILIVCFAYFDTTLQFLELAHSKGIRAPDYVMLDYNIRLVDVYAYEPWFGLQLDIEEMKRILVETNYKVIRPAGIKGKKAEDFYNSIPVTLAGPPWNVKMNTTYQGKISAVVIYNGAYAYFTVLDEILRNGEDYTDGELIHKRISNGTFKAFEGTSVFDAYGDVKPNIWIFDIHPGWKRMEEVMRVVPDPINGKTFFSIDGLSVHWGTEGNVPPPDTPTCGFRNELCPDDTLANIQPYIAAGVAVLVLVIGGIISALFYRQYKEEEALQQTVWKINFGDITQGKRQAGSVANMSQATLQSEASFGAENEGLRQLFTEVGHYKQNLVAILRVDKRHIALRKADMKEMKVMKDMNHQNVAKFVGACVEPPNICYVMMYYTKGSLQDIIENDVIGLDWMFKTSLLSDLANGMSYLHRSDLQSHGSLKSSCCMVDSRWQLKVSSYGLHAFKDGEPKEKIGEQQRYQKMLWTAPELLRLLKHERPQYGTQAGDVYSFAVIAQEIIYRTSPFFLDEESTKDVISKLTKPSAIPYRPILPKVDPDIPSESIDLIKTCWAEDPKDRPTFDKIIRNIQAMNKNKKTDIMANLIEKLERYANNLEDIVNQRTAELLVEKKKTDTLLASMLPVSVVEALKRGEKINAEIFEAVTVFFSDIVGFTSLSLASSPFDIVKLLNGLYNIFDDMIKIHDVYKVETISDSYMVVSGLPIRNGNKHVGEVANLALDLMSEALTFKIKHRPGLKLQLRIGFHTGSCAAGVVGLSMPRYCLFGDTVNMASRMETNGKALMIHMSKFAYTALDTLGGYKVRARGEMQIKGKGSQMTYWLIGKTGYTKPLPTFEG